SQHVRIKEKLLRAVRKIVDRPQQRAVIKNSSAPAKDGLARLKWVIRERHARSEVIQIADDGFIFKTKAIAERQVRLQTPFILREKPGVSIVLRRGRQKVL